ncbi:MAG TPA: hypothetical protein VK897_21915 [Anaerolineales bacterium]|nr:hypothetical protein [Anaerolineales bacterium]
MLDNTSPIDGLVAGIKEASGLLSKLLSRKFALVVFVVILVVMISTLVLS